MVLKSRPDRLSVIAPIVSAVVVALITAWTNVRLGNLETLTKFAVVEVEQRKIRDQQDARREAFMERHLGKLLSENDSDRRLGRALLFVAYPSDAGDIIKQVLPAATKDVQSVLREVSAEAAVVKRETGEWSIIISSDTTPDLAQEWAANAKSAKFSPVAIYHRNGFYAVAVGRYPSRNAAEQAAVAVRPKTRSDAFVVALGRWCTGGKVLPSEAPIVQCPDDVNSVR